MKKWTTSNINGRQLIYNADNCIKINTKYEKGKIINGNLLFKGVYYYISISSIVLYLLL